MTAGEPPLSWLASIAPHVVAQARPISGTWLARPEEEAGLERAGRQRLAEFRAGRCAARNALAQLGAHVRAIPRLASGAPAWPKGIVGSISHCENLAIAVVARASRVAQLGFDMEADSPLEPDLVDRVCGPGELTADPRMAASRIDEAKLAFVAKEAWYKAIHPRTGETPDFRDVAIRVSAADWTFEIDAPARFGRPLGHFGRGEGLIFALVLSPA